MAQQTKNTLYGWAVRGWKPLAQQIKDWYDSFWHKDESIPINSVEGLTAILNTLANGESLDGLLDAVNGESVLFNADGTYVIPDTKSLIEILVKPTANINFRIGSAAGLDDLVLEQPVDTANPQWITLRLYANGNRTLYINGITAPTTIIFYKK